MAIETISSTEDFKALVTEVTSQSGHKEPVARFYRQTLDSSTGKRTLVQRQCSSKHYKKLK